MKINKQSGISLIEVIIAVGIISVLLLGITQLIGYSLTTIRKNERQAQATALASEAMETLRFVRDSDWATFAALDTLDYLHPESNGTIASGCDTVDIFTRCIKLSEVNRDAVTGDPVDSGGVLDNDSRAVSINVSWVDQGNNREVDIISYLTNWR